MEGVGELELELREKMVPLGEGGGSEEEVISKKSHRRRQEGEVDRRQAQEGNLLT